MPLACFHIAAVEMLWLTLHEWQAEDEEVARVECHNRDKENHDLEEVAAPLTVFFGPDGSLDCLLIRKHLSSLRVICR